MTTDDRLENLVRDHARRAYGLALALIGQASDADDLVQRAVLVAARKRALIPLDGAWPWFARILALEARNMRRKSRPAALSEEVMGVEDPGHTDPASLARERELATDLGRELAMLPDHEREAIVLIHVSGMSYREASAALSLAPATLSQHVKAAIDRLRRRLGLAEASLCASLGLLGATPPPGGFETAITRWLLAAKGGAGVGLASAIGGLIMGKKVIGILALVVLLAIASYGLKSMADSKDRLAPVRGSDRAEETAPWDPRRASSPDVEAGANNEKTPVSTAVFGRIRGHVLDSRGEPRSGVRVRLEAVDPSLGVEATETMSDEDGRYELAPLLPIDAQPSLLTFSLEASDDLHAGSRRSGLWLESGVELEDIDLLIFGSARVRGRVVDAKGGAPLPGVLVRVEPIRDGMRPLIHAGSGQKEARTDGAGRFVFEGLPPGPFRPRVSRVREGGGEDLLEAMADLELDLLEGERKEGVELVVSTARLGFTLTSAPGGSVQFNYRIADNWWNTVAFPDLGVGPYSVTGFAGEVKSYYVSAPGKQSRTLEGQGKAGEDFDAGLIELENRRRAGGIVLDADGAPASGANLRLESADRRVLTAALTDAEGRFFVSEPAEGDWTIVVDHRDHALLRTTMALPAGDFDQVIRLSRGGEIAGRVTIAGRAPSPAQRGADGRDDPVFVVILAEAANLPAQVDQLRYLRYAAIPGSDGTFTLAAVAPGRYRVRAIFEKRTVSSEVVEVIEGRTTPVSLDLGPGGVLIGQVRDGERPAAGVALRLARQAQELRQVEGEIYGRSDAEGKFRFEGLPAGVWYLKCGHETMLAGKLVAARRVEIEEGQEHRLDLEISSSRPLLAGRVVVGGRARIKTALLMRPGVAMPQARAAVAQDGSFTLDGVADGSYYLWLVDDLYNPKIAHRLAVELAAARPLKLDEDLAAGVLSGNLIGADEAKLTLRPLLEDSLGADAAARFAVIILAAREGRFSSGELVAGRYELVVTAKGHSPIEQEVEVSGTTEIQVDLAARGGVLSLNIAELRGFRSEDLAGGFLDRLLLVRILDEEGAEVGSLDESRYLRLERGRVVNIALAPGRYRVLVQGKLAETIAEEVVVAEGETTSRALRPRRAAEYRLKLEGEGLDVAALAGMRLSVLRPDGSRVEEVDLALAAGAQDQVALAESILRVQPLTAGTYRILLEVPGFEAAETSVTMATSEVQEGRLRLDRQP